MPSAASFTNHAKERKRAQAAKIIPGAKALHRGIHVHQNNNPVNQWLKNPKIKRSDPKELLVHHQKINEELKDVYSRTAALQKEDMTMAERIEQSWRDFERIGGQRPKQVIGYQKHLNQLRDKKKTTRERAKEEFRTQGEFTDYRQGSALHDTKDKRIGKFVKGQLKRAHMLRRFGDPTPLKQSGKFDRHKNTFEMHHKTLRKMKREIANEEKISSVKPRGRTGKSRSMWDTSDFDLNRPAIGVKRQLDRQDDILQPDRKRKRK